MSLKMSLFNKSIFKSDIKQCWWTALLEAFLIFVFTVFPIYGRVTNYVEGDAYSFGYLTPSWIYFGGIVVLVASSVGMATRLFSYMHFQGSLSMHHSIPVRRSEMLFTKSVTGLLLLIIPIILNAVLLAFLCSYPVYMENVGYLPILKWCLRGAIYACVLFSLTSAVNMMTGNPVGTLVFTGGFMLLPLVLSVFLETFLNAEVFGMNSSDVMEFLNYVYISEKSLLTAPYAFVYPLLSVIFFAGAYVLYKKRKLESNGEVIAYSWLKPIFIAIIATLSSLLGWAYFEDVLNQDGILWLIPLGLVGTIIAWMVSRKSLSPKGIHKPVCIYLVVTLLFAMVIHFDLTGYERRIPKAMDVAHVYVGEKPADSGFEYFYNERVGYTMEGSEDTSFCDMADIENVIALHKAIVELHDENAHGMRLPIEYTLKNGRTLKRDYMVDPNKLKDAMRPVFETPQMRATYYELIRRNIEQYISLEVNDRRINGGDSIYINKDDARFEIIIDALKKDMEEATLEEMNRTSGASTYIYVTYNMPMKYEKDMEGIASSKEMHHGYSIPQSFTHTIEALNSIGYYDTLPEASDITSVQIDVWEGDEYRSDKEVNSVATITDKKEIEALYSIYYEMIEEINYHDLSSACNVRLTYTLKSGKTFMVSCSYDKARLPEQFKAYF